MTETVSICPTCGTKMAESAMDKAFAEQRHAEWAEFREEHELDVSQRRVEELETGIKKLMGQWGGFGEVHAIRILEPSDLIGLKERQELIKDLLVFDGELNEMLKKLKFEWQAFGTVTSQEIIDRAEKEYAEQQQVCTKSEDHVWGFTVDGMKCLRCGFIVEDDTCIDLVEYAVW